jgi:hypothetical protein
VAVIIFIACNGPQTLHLRTQKAESRQSHLVTNTPRSNSSHINNTCFSIYSGGPLQSSPPTQNVTSSLNLPRTDRLPSSDHKDEPRNRGTSTHTQPVPISPTTDQVCCGCRTRTSTKSRRRSLISSACSQWFTMRPSRSTPNSPSRTRTPSTSAKWHRINYRNSTSSNSRNAQSPGRTRTSRESSPTEWKEIR